MVKIDALIFGYRKMSIAPDRLSTLTSILLRASVPSVINNDGTVIVRERDIDKIIDLISGRIEYSLSEPLGIYGWWKRLKYKWAILISICISITMITLLSGIVWDIRVEGNTSVTDSEVILKLRDCGFEIGDYWAGVDRSELETAFLADSEEISWININRRGCVAYIKVIEKEYNDKEIAEGDEPSNLVASTDCVIEEITVKRGIAVVKPGDTVKKGDILVIGALPPESGGGFCSAEANVVGRINDTVSIEVARNYEKKTDREKKLYSITLNLFKFSLNIFKRYGNLTNECVIIEDEIKCSLFNKCKLPLSVKRVYIVDYEYENAVYTDDELVKIASDRLMSLSLSRLYEADLLKIKTEGDFTDEGYRIMTHMVFLSDVSERVKLDIEK